MNIPSKKEYSPTLWEWLVPLVVMWGGLMVIMETERALKYREVETWPIWVLLGGTAVGWAVAWWQREKNPWLRELAGVAAAGCWCMSSVWVDAAYALHCTELVLLVSFLGLAWVPWVLRQRVVLGVVMLQSICLLAMLMDTLRGMLPPNSLLDLPDIVHPLVWMKLLPALAAYGWWMLAERLREHRGRYAGYGWVGVPACVMCQFIVLFCCITAREAGAKLLVPMAGMVIVALMLRPRVAWWRWLVTVVAAALPIVVHELTDASMHVLGATTLLFPIAMMWLAVVQRRREWVPCSALVLSIALVANPEWRRIGDPEFYNLACIGFVATLAFYLYRKACRPHHD